MSFLLPKKMSFTCIVLASTSQLGERQRELREEAAPKQDDSF